MEIKGEELEGGVGWGHRGVVSSGFTMVFNPDEGRADRERPNSSSQGGEASKTGDGQKPPLPPFARTSFPWPVRDSSTQTQDESIRIHLQPVRFWASRVSARTNDCRALHSLCHCFLSTPRQPPPATPVPADRPPAAPADPPLAPPPRCGCCSACRHRVS
ncbi:unnamed protein product [Menidia menidia]|uniref:(Atlantic silverside) hypothetical protein n=1 Tax=Menidia menidia TaxID=238744 RepID=A0A8S4AX78_9TELE|nr:unnamed protein product [Menidia menidia]